MENEVPSNEQPAVTDSQDSSRSIWFPIVLILIGVAFLVQQFTSFTLTNWWALFILIPAFSTFGTAFAMWRRAGRLTYGIWSTFYGGLLPLLVAVIFLFNLDWSVYWPLFVIVPGFGVMISGLPFRRPEDSKLPDALVVHRYWLIMIGLSAMLLGVVFLLAGPGNYTAISYIPFTNWWGVFILIPALGGLLTALVLMLRGYSPVLTVINLAAAAIIAFAGIVALYELDWELMKAAGPALLILAGAALLVGFGRRSAENDSE